MYDLRVMVQWFVANLTSSVFRHALHAQSCSQSLLQRFDDAVITFMQASQVMPDEGDHIISNHCNKNSEQLSNILHCTLIVWQARLYTCNDRPTSARK